MSSYVAKVHVWLAWRTHCGVTMSGMDMLSYVKESQFSQIELQENKGGIYNVCRNYVVYLILVRYHKDQISNYVSLQNH